MNSKATFVIPYSCQAKQQQQNNWQVLKNVFFKFIDHSFIHSLWVISICTQSFFFFTTFYWIVKCVFIFGIQRSSLKRAKVINLFQMWYVLKTNFLVNKNANWFNSISVVIFLIKWLQYYQSEIVNIMPSYNAW